MSIENRLIKIGVCILSVLAVIVSAICMFERFKDGLWLVPLVYAICFFVTLYVKNAPCYNLAMLIIMAVLYVRDVFVPLLYYKANPTHNLVYDVENEAFYLRYSTSLMYNVEVISILILETVVIFAVIYFCANKYAKMEMSVETETNPTIRKVGIAVLPFILAGVIVFLRQPRNSGIFDLIHNLWWDFMPSSLEVILFDVATVLLALTVLSYIAAKCKRNVIGFLASVIVWLIFCVEAAVGTLNMGTISRWAFIINFIVGYFILIKMFPKYMKIFTIVAVAGGMVVILITSLAKSHYSIGSILTYRMFNVYFAGPSSMGYVIELIKAGEHDINVVTLICDALGNVPIINHYLPQGVSSVLYYNNLIYGNELTVDQVIPFSGQWYGYFSYFGVIIGNSLASYLAIKTCYLAKKESRILFIYVLMFVSVLLSIITIININILFQYLSIKLFPIFVIGCADIVLNKLLDSWKAKHK